MKLTRLEAFGFKSFADRTVIDFHGGVTSFVGPNGCGKSNVVDAIRWALGEQSAKSLRGSEMMDVVFRGSRDRKPAGYGEVSLVFENEDGALPVPSREVQITRRLYRTGESEYLLNKQPCRLRDLRGLFLDTGVGVSAYSVIEQGRVGALVQGTPQDRRAVLDEAAGISRFRAHVHQATLRLERTSQNMQRVADVLEEVQRRLKSIRRAAARARRYRELEAEVRTAREALGRLRLRILGEEADRLSRAREGLQDRAAGAQATLAQRAAREAESQEARTRAEEALRQASEGLARVEEQARTALERAQEAARRSADAARERDAAAAEAQRLGTQRDGQAERLRELDAQEAGLAAERAAAQEALRAAEAAAGALETDLAVARSALEEARASLMDAVREQTDVSNARRAIEEELRTRQVESGQVEEAGRRAEEGTAELRGREESLASRVQELETRSEALRTGVEAVAARQEARAGDERALHGEIERLRYEIGKGESRIELLADLERQREGVSAAVQRVLDAQREGRAGIAGVQGLVADFCESDLGIAGALDAALGDDGQALVVSTLGDAVRIADFVRRGDGGQVVLWPLNALAPDGDPRAPAPGGDGIVGYALDLLQAPPDVRPVLDRALRDVLVVEDREAALRLRREGWWGPLVTVEGERYGPGSIRAAGRGGALGLLSRRAEIDRLRDALEGERRTLGTREEAREGLAGERERLAQERERLETERAGILEALARAQAEREEARAACQVARARQEAQGRAVEGVRAACEAARERLAGLAERESGLADRVEAGRTAASGAQEALDRLEARRHGAQEACASAREGAARLGERSGSIAQARRAFEETLRMLAAQAESASRRVVALEGERARHEAERTDLERLAAGTDGALGAARAQGEEARRAHDAAQQEVAARRAAVQEAERAARDAERALERGLADLEQAQGRRDEWVERHRREWSIDLSAPASPADEGLFAQVDEAQWEARLSEARGQIDRLGGVNLEALAEQEEMEVRATFLEAQLADLQEAKRALGDLITRMNDLSRERFAATFAQVQEQFGGIFRKLFGGGKAELRIEEGVDLLDAGIEIVARPPGKELMPISLLSGGEKAMTAVALLFGVFRSRPSPFCILDEVDAPLDESNIDRFLAVLKGFLDRSQFLIITHKKRTMRMADRIYGITQQEPGVSRWISLRFEEVAPTGA